MPVTENTTAGSATRHFAVTTLAAWVTTKALKATGVALPADVAADLSNTAITEIAGVAGALAAGVGGLWRKWVMGA